MIIDLAPSPMKFESLGDDEIQHLRLIASDVANYELSPSFCQYIIEQAPHTFLHSLRNANTGFVLPRRPKRLFLHYTRNEKLLNL